MLPFIPPSRYSSQLLFTPSSKVGANKTVSAVPSRHGCTAIMSSSKKNIEEEVNASDERTQQGVRQFVQISFEKEVNSRVAVLKESFLGAESTSATTTTVADAAATLPKEDDHIMLNGSSEAAGTIIRNNATEIRSEYHSLDCNGKAIVTLGLNSILDLSFQFPAAQSRLFTRSQRRQLDALFPPKKCPIDSYSYIKQKLSSLGSCYDENKSKEVNWKSIYKELKRLENLYDHELNPEHNDVNFCIHFLLQILSIIKHQPHLFRDEIDKSEWDFVVDFWGVITVRLFHKSGLRLKWGDTHLTVHDTISDLLLKVDLRILHDEIRQGRNQETDVGVMEAAEEQPGDAKFTFDRCKVLVESKAMIDKFILDGCLITSVDALQICGLEIHFVNLTLEAPGAYIGTQFFTGCIGNSMDDILQYLDLAIHLLCFRDKTVSIMNKYESHLSAAHSSKVSAKRKYGSLPEEILMAKQELVRGSWSPPRTSKTPPPP